MISRVIIAKEFEIGNDVNEHEKENERKIMQEVIVGMKN